MGDHEHQHQHSTPRMKQNWVNTGGIGLVILMLGWGGNKGFDKLDEANTATIELKGDISRMQADMADLKSQVALMVTRDMLQIELGKRDETISDLQREIQGLRQHTIRVAP